MALIPQPTREQTPWVLTNIPQTYVLKVLKPQELVFLGKVKAVASTNYLGPFDVLPGHTNIISIIYKDAKIYPESGDQIDFKFDVGILRFINNSADLYLGLEFTAILQQLPPEERRYFGLAR